MTLRPQSVAKFLPMVDEVAEDFIQRLREVRNKDDMVINLKNEVEKWNLESAAMSVFERRLWTMESKPSDYQPQIINANKTIMALSVKLKFSIPIYKYISTPSLQKLEMAEHTFNKICERLVDETVENIKDLERKEELKEGQYFFLSYLLSNPNITYDDVTITAQNRLADGLTSTTTILIGTMHLLAKFPEVQMKLYKEVSNVLSICQEVTDDILAQLPYLKACVKEAQRFFVSTFDIPRVAPHNIVIGGYRIPAGTRVDMNQNALLCLAEYFPEPEQYRPERWLRESGDRSIHPYLHLPFGHGPRMCPGRRFAEQELYTILAKLVVNYRIQSSDEPLIQIKYRMTTKVEGQASIKLTDRD